MRVFVITATILTMFGTPLSALEVGTRLVARDIQRAEQIISAAETAHDYPEMRRQADNLLLLSGKLPDQEDVGTRVVCGVALQSLRNLAADLSEPKLARKMVSATRERKMFLESMNQCEVAVGLQPPSAPNLRTLR